MTTKQCTGCGHDKPLEDFYRLSSAQDGRRARCKSCIIVDARERRARRRQLDPEAHAHRLAQKRKSKERARRRAGIEPKQIGRSPLCTYATCKRVGVAEGLCDDHHHEVTKGDESPLVLVGGRWEKGVGGVRRWVA